MFRDPETITTAKHISRMPSCLLRLYRIGTLDWQTSCWRFHNAHAMQVNTLKKGWS